MPKQQPDPFSIDDLQLAGAFLASHAIATTPAESEERVQVHELVPASADTPAATIFVVVGSPALVERMKACVQGDLRLDYMRAAR